jgi:hypothetical protein
VLIVVACQSRLRQAELRQTEPRQADLGEDADVGQDGGAPEQRHEQRGVGPAVADEDLPGGERAADGGQAGRSQHDLRLIRCRDGPRQHHDRRGCQRDAQQRVHGEGEWPAEKAGVLRNRDVQVEEDADDVLKYQQHQGGQARLPQPLLTAAPPGAPPGAPRWASRMLAETSRHETFTRTLPLA